MITYEVYKIIHLTFIFLFLMGLSASLIAPTPPKHIKIFSGISSFLILVAGMGLMARIGVAHGEGFPGWIIAKIVLWLVLAVGGPILAKRGGPQAKVLGFYGVVVLSSVAAWLAIYKPGS